MFAKCNLNSFIKNFDFFPMEVELNIDEEQKKSTIIGGCCSILLIFLTLILTILNFTIYFQNKKPIIVNTNQFIKNRNPINISSDRFLIIQYFYDSDFHPIIFTLKQNNIINHFTKFDKTKQILSNNRLGLNINCQNATNLNSDVVV